MRGIYLVSFLLVLLTARAQEPEVCKQALSKYKAADYEAALQLYNQCIQYETGNGVPYYNRGKTYYELGLKDKALADYEKAIMLSPEFVQSYYAISEHYLSLEDKDQALFWINRAITLNPTLSTAFDLRGWVYFNFGQYKLAFNDFSQAIKLDPENATAYNNRASARFLIQDIAEASEADLLMARQDYVMALSLQDSLPNAHRNLGYIELLLGNLGAADSMLSLAARRQPKDPMVYLYQAKLAVANDNWTLANDKLDRTLELNTKIGEAWYYKGLYQMEKCQYREAVDLFTKAYLLDEQIAPDAWYQRARAHAKLFEHDLMMQSLNELEKLNYFSKLDNRDKFVHDPAFAPYDRYKPFRKYMQQFKP